MRNNKMANFGEWVRRNLTAHGKTITWLADQIHANPTMVIKWRSGVEPRTKNFLYTCLAIAELRGDPMPVVIREASLHLGVPYDNTINYSKYTGDQK
jgi:hypothetical protein